MTVSFDQKFSSVVAGIGYYVPEQVVTSKFVDEQLNGIRYLGVGNMIEKIAGIKERRYASSKMQASDIAVLAARDALEQAGLTATDVDTVLFTACSRDIAEPATANVVQAKLGAVRARAMDVTNACNSALSGLEVMNSLIASGKTKVGLVVAGEKLSTVVNWNLKNIGDLKTGFAALTLGDGGGAMVLTANNNHEKRGIAASYFVSDGKEWPLSVVLGGGTLSPRNLDDTYFRSDSLKLNKLALKYVPYVIEKVMKITGWSFDELDLAVPHQVTVSVAEKIAKRVKFPFEKVMITVDRFGNTGAASTLMALREAINQGRVTKGSKVMLVGGAAGFSAGAITLIL
jgi:3-oxoacyl-[acyl-carrier-protein] synthase-3